MEDFTQSPVRHSAKSPLIFLLIIGVLVIGTLVVASEYFLRPQMELELKKQISHSFNQVGLGNTIIELSGRDVVLNGDVDSIEAAIKAEKTSKEIWGIRQVDNQLLIRK